MRTSIFAPPVGHVHWVRHHRLQTLRIDREIVLHLEEVMIDGKESVANSVMIPEFTLLEAHDSRPNASSARI